MKIVVLKFGGTSVGTISRIKIVANIIINYIKKKYKVIVVSSAMSGETNKLVKKSQSLSNEFDNSEYDVLVSSGEQIACALIAGRLRHLGYKSQSWMGWQIPILTDENHSSGRIIKINKKKIIKYLKTGGTPIVTGFQGINLNQRIQRTSYLYKQILNTKKTKYVNNIFSNVSSYYRLMKNCMSLGSWIDSMTEERFRILGGRSTGVKPVTFLNIFVGSCAHSGTCTSSSTNSFLLPTDSSLKIARPKTCPYYV